MKERRYKIATATPKNKIVRAYTAKDIESDTFECALINQLNKDIYSIDDGDLRDKITAPVGAQLNNSWEKGTELESSLSKHSATLSSAIEKVVTEAEEGTPEALTIPLYLRCVQLNIPESAGGGTSRMGRIG